MPIIVCIVLFCLALLFFVVVAVVEARVNVGMVAMLLLLIYVLIERGAWDQVER